MRTVEGLRLERLDLGKLRREAPGGGPARVLGALTLLALSFGACDPGARVQPSFDGSLDGSLPPNLMGLVSVRLEPPDVSVRSVDGSTPSVTFTAIGTFDDGREEDISDQLTFVAVGRSDLGFFDGPTFTAFGTVGGTTSVEVRAGPVGVQGSLTVVLERSASLPPGGGADPIPDDPTELFGGPEEPARAPTLVYPNAGVVFPPNLGRVEIHWLRGPRDNTLFELAFVNDVTDVRFYARCERPEGIQDDGCIVEPSGQTWAWVARTNAGGDPVTLRIRATDDAGSALGVSATADLAFSRDEVDGTIYYWTVSDGGQIVRFDFGSDAVEGERVLGPEATQSGSCVGCHALSRDGRKLVGSVGGQNRGGMVLMDLESFTAVRNESERDDHILQFASFRPDGDEMVGIYGDDEEADNYGDLLLFDTRCDAANMATCGDQTSKIELGGAEASHPDWAPDDSRIAYTDVGQHNTSQRPLAGAIAYVEREGNGWSGPVELVPRVSGISRYNPHFAPDSSFLVYNESTCPGGDNESRACNGDTDPSATIWAVPRNGGDPVLLANATAPGVLDESGDLANTFPRFTPFEFVLLESDTGRVRLMWLSFSSTRRYGLRETLDSGSGESDRGTYLWMVAIQPDRLFRGEDPSFAPFALPFQDLTTSNHIATWTTESVGEIPLD